VICASDDAIELYLHGVRPLHDLDFVAASFDCLPSGLGKAILIRHAHPHDPPAKTMLQAVDARQVLAHLGYC
jgi:hypothetical protein